MQLALAILVALILASSLAMAEDPIDIGSRLELLIDEHLIDAMSGDVRLQLHRPTRREIVFETDAPWEGNASAYQSVFRDGDVCRMYYRGCHYRHSGPPAQTVEDHPWYLCYAESDDGVTWRRPELGIFEFNGDKGNNIVLAPAMLEEIGGDPAHTAVFLDENPDCPPEERIKCVILGKPHGLYALGSGDGVNFTVMSTEPIITEGAFDSQNLAFWDPVREEYREYHRGFKEGVRGIMTATSDDFLHFPDPEWLTYVDSQSEHLYTNQIQPYYRAPHIFMGFPMRYSDRGWSEPMLDLPGVDERIVRAKSHPRYGTTVTDGLFMTSRDGNAFYRWAEAFIRPGPRERHSWVYGDNFIFWGMIETPSAIEDTPDEISMFAVDGYWEGPSTSVRRYTLRTDGFVSASAPMSGGEFTTKPLVFDGGNLTINAETSGAGSVRVEVQDADGAPLDGYTLDECPPIFCDSLRHVVRWEYPGGDVRELAGKPVRLRFEVKDADLYAFGFVPYAPEPERPDVVGVGALPRKSKDRAIFEALIDDFEAEGPSAQWTIRAGSPERAAIVDADPPGGGRCLKLERLDESHAEGGAAWLALAPQDAADSAKGHVEVMARIYVPSSNARVVDIDACDSPLGEFARRAFNVRFWPDGQVSYFRSIENPIEGMSFTPDTWVSVHIRADMASSTFDLVVGERTAQGLPFGDEAVHRVQSICFSPNTNNCTMYLDDVRVVIEP